MIRLFFAMELFIIFIKEVVVANLQVAWLVFQPTKNLRPALFKLPLQLKSEWGITCLAHMITLTPGTITISMAKDKSALYVHVLHSQDIAETRQSIKTIFERRLIRLFDRTNTRAGGSA